MFKNPFFTIIIPTYNRQHFLKIAINSCLYQTYPDFELIIVDDGSTDGTKTMVKKINDSRIKYLWQPHQEVSAARNQGILSAQGEYICFLDSDDRFRIQKLEITYQYIKKYPEFKIFHSEEIWYRNFRLLPQKKHHQKPEGNVFNRALKLCCISISTCCIKKDVFEKIGLFDENLPVCEDYDFWLRVSVNYPVKLIPKILTIKQGGHYDQQSKRYPALDRFRIYALKKLIENSSLNPQQKKLVVNELKRKCEIYIEGAKKRGKIAEAEYYQNLVNLLT
ncbi:MAG: hypothetical protein B6D55_03535 [Candidatus Omnitrophica bacterium 4484_70.2]|nr:MAG: hypothetical protein B6D55_03535 [Candidatus Omnitrophica bacterium 4484_70.2]